MGLTCREVAEILKIIDTSDCEELVLELGDTKLVVRRRGARASERGGDDRPGAAARPRSIPQGHAAETASSPPPRTRAAPREQEKSDGLLEVRAPMVGTFYRAPAPDAPPFVEVGSCVRAGDPLCLIEVMKLYTTIEAERAGRVTEIAAENGAAVEWGELLFVTAPAAESAA